MSSYRTEIEDESSKDYLLEIVRPEGKATPFGTFFNLSNCAIGAGILGLPFAFTTMGLVLGIIFWLLVAVVSSYTLHLLITVAEKTQSSSYEQVIEKAFGVWALRGTQLIIFVYTFGVVVGYLIIVGDLMPPVIAKWADVPLNSGKWWLSPQAISGLSTAVIILPLALLKKLDLLKWASMFAIAAITYFLLLIIVLAAIDFQNRGPTPPYQGEFSYFYWSINMFQGIPILFFASGGHLQAIGLYSELAPRYRNVPTWDTIVISVETGVLSFFYLLVGGISYCRFYPVDNGNILKLMAQNDDSIPIQIASVAISLVVILSAPLVLFPMRQTLDTLVFRNWPDLYTDQTWPTRLRYVGWTVLLVGITYTVNAVVGDLKLVFGLTGAIGATTIKVILPTAVYLKQGPFFTTKEGYETISDQDSDVQSLHLRSPGALPLWKKCLCWFIILFGITLGSICTAVVILRAIKP